MSKHIVTPRNYGKASLLEKNCPSDPIELFSEWFNEAIKNEPYDPNAMTLATVNSFGHPTARIVLLKEIHDTGFVFYTNYKSAKARDFDQLNYAALVFWWPVGERQIRVEGTVEKVPTNISDNYFQTRSKESKIGAHISPQSQIIPNRSVLDEKFKEFENIYSNNKDIPRPTNWGGYLLSPLKIEFWQGGAHRLHDRICYEKQDGHWEMQRLAP